MLSTITNKKWVSYVNSHFNSGAEIGRDLEKVFTFTVSPLPRVLNIILSDANITFGRDEKWRGKNIRRKDFKRGNRKVIYLVFGTRGSEKRGKKEPYRI